MRLDSSSRPRVRRGVSICPADEGRWQIRRDFDEVTFLEGEACAELLPWLIPILDGTRSVAQLREAAREHGSDDGLIHVLECLDEHDALTTEPPHASLETIAPQPSAVMAKLRATEIPVCGRSPLATCLIGSLRNMGFPTTPSHSAEETWAGGLPPVQGHVLRLPVVIETDWQPRAIESFNAWAVANRQPWFLLGAWNQRVLVGPLFIPGETACHTCFRKRLDSHRHHPGAAKAFDAWRNSESVWQDPHPILPAIAELAASWAALAIFHHVSGLRPSRLAGRVMVVHPEDGRTQIEPVPRLPWCDACANSTS